MGDHGNSCDGGRLEIQDCHAGNSPQSEVKPREESEERVERQNCHLETVEGARSKVSEIATILGEAHIPLHIEDAVVRLFNRL